MSRWADCEVDGAVTLIYHRGPPQRCIIGYVTSGMAQDFHFRAEPSSCETVSEKVLP